MPDVAAFDFDGTLTEGGSVFDFLTAVTDRRTVTAASVALAPRLAHAALAGGEAADETKQLLVTRVLRGVDSARVAAVSAEFADRHLAANLRPDVRRRFDWHRRRGDRVVIVSASFECYVGEAGRILGADDAIATRLEVDGHGQLTGRYEGRNCRGEEKLRRLLLWVDEHLPGEEQVGAGATARGATGSRVPSPRLWAYGNSRGDLRMLRAADVGVNVGRLGRVGRLRAYPGLDHAQTLRAEG